MATSPRHATLANLRGANKEAQGRYLGDVSRRELASTILHPHEVAGEYDAGRMLGTTLGGAIRAITHDDIRAFKKNVKTAGKKFKGGITAKSVIDMSLPVDRERSNKEIRTAVPAQSMGGRVHFITNAGPNSGVTRHHVHIELLNYSAAVSSPSKLPEMAKFLGAGPLKFDCDCERHTFYFRYVATIGNYNAGRGENGFPKITNPHLVGVACKHVLRVMQVINTPSIRLQLEKMISRGRGEITGKSKMLTTKEAQAIAEQQEKQANWKRNTVESGAERGARLERGRAIKVVFERAKAKLSKVTPAVLSSAKRKAIAGVKEMMRQGELTQAQAEMILATIK